jgi:hypothetical protein
MASEVQTEELGWDRMWNREISGDGKTIAAPFWSLCKYSVLRLAVPRGLMALGAITRPEHQPFPDANSYVRRNTPIAQQRLSAHPRS